MQPGLKNLTDHFLEEWFWRPGAIVSYSAGSFAGVRASTAWHGTLSEMGMIVVSSTLAVSEIANTLDTNSQPIGPLGEALRQAFPDSLMISSGRKRLRLSAPAILMEVNSLSATERTHLGLLANSEWCQ